MGDYMTKIEIKTRFIQGDEESDEFKTSITDCFDGFSFSWQIDQEIVSISAQITFEKKYLYSSETKKVEDKLKDNPCDKELKLEYERLREDDSDWEALVTFRLLISPSVNLDKNEIVFSKEKSTETSGSEWGYFDSFYDVCIAKLNMALVMAFVFAKPGIHIWNSKVYINDTQYADENYVKEIMPIGTLKEYQTIKKVSVSYTQALDWIKKHTSLCNQCEKSPSAFSAITYVFNRQYHEGLIYSIIGLESIYSPGKSGISYTLQKRINAIFPMVSKDEIKRMYGLRSKFVHGELSISNCDLLPETLDDYDQFSDTAFMAMSLLFETVRVLISNNADSIIFNETISYDFK